MKSNTEKVWESQYGDIDIVLNNIFKNSGYAFEFCDKTNGYIIPIKSADLESLYYAIKNIFQL